MALARSQRYLAQPDPLPSCENPPPPGPSVPLAQVHLFPLSVMFGLCAVFLAVAALCQMRMERLAMIMAPVTKGLGMSNGV